jgi:hypothetical protein
MLTSVHLLVHCISLSFQCYFIYQLHEAGGSILLEKPAVAPLAKKFLAFCATERFIILFTLNWAHLTLSWFIPILSTYICLGIQCGLFPSSFSTKILYPWLISHIYATAAWFDHLNIWWSSGTQPIIFPWDRSREVVLALRHIIHVGKKCSWVVYVASPRKFSKNNLSVFYILIYIVNHIFEDQYFITVLGLVGFVIYPKKNTTLKMATKGD